MLSRKNHQLSRKVFAGLVSVMFVFSLVGPVISTHADENDVTSIDTPSDTPLPTDTPAPTDTPTPSDPPIEQDVAPTGSITVCKIIIDKNGNVVDGSTLPGTNFIVPGVTPELTSADAPVGQIPDTLFTTPLTFNTKLISTSDGYDANCATYSNLSLGGYYYGNESMNNPSNWDTPKYNDQYSISVTSLSDFFAFDSNLYDGDPSNDGSRNQNSDGHIVLNTDTPNRTLVVLNQLPEKFKGSITVCKVVKDGKPCEPWADSIVVNSFNQGLDNHGDAVALSRSDTSKALGTAENDDTLNFVSLGFGGSIVLKFDNYITNGAGDDLALTETTFGSPDCSAYPEKVHAYASKDGVSWTDIGTGCQDSTFDLGSLDWAQYIKLVDISNPADFDSNSVSDGFDVDGVMAIHCSNTMPGTKFTIDSIIPVTSSVGAPVGTFGTSVFTLPLTFNTDLLNNDDINDAQCYTYGNLPLGGYYYGQEVIDGLDSWLAPRYNDQYDVSVGSDADAFTFDSSLYDGDSSNDASRNQNSDGHILLKEGRPDRTLVVFNEPGVPTPTPSATPIVSPTPSISVSPSPSVTPTPTPDGGGGGGGSNASVGGGGGGGGSGFVSTPTPSPEVIALGGSTGEVLGASTTLPATGFSSNDAFLFRLFGAIALIGLFMLMAGFGLTPKKLLSK